MDVENVKRLIEAPEGVELEYKSAKGGLPEGFWESFSALPTPFMLNGISRVEETPAHIALREALVNSLIHASYSEPGSIVITRWPDRIVMRNPGRMLVSIEDFFSGGYSIPRNPILQKMFMLLGYGEKAGSGADTMKKGLAEVGWSDPILTERVQPDAIEITLVKLNVAVHAGGKYKEEKLKDEKSTEKDEKSTEKDEKSTEKSEGSTEKNEKSTEMILRLLRENPKVTIAMLAKKLGISSRPVEKHLRKLREDGRIRRIGPDKGGYWVVTE